MKKTKGWFAGRRAKVVKKPKPPETMMLPKSRVMLVRGHGTNSWEVPIDCHAILKLDGGPSGWFVSWGWTMIAKGTKAKCIAALDDAVLAIRAAVAPVSP